MINIQNIYVLNRHRGTPSLMRVNDSRIINNLNRDIEHLIPFWSIINKYCPDSTARNFHAMIFDARYIDGYYVRQPWPDPTPVLNTVDHLLQYSRIYEPIKTKLRELRDIPGLDQEPGPFANDTPDIEHDIFARSPTASLSPGKDKDDDSPRSVTKRSRHRNEDNTN